MPRSDVSYSPLTPLSFLKRSWAVFPQKVAIIDGSIRYTYDDFASRVNRLAGAIRQEGLQKGERVAFLSPNTPPLLEAHYGVPLAGCALVAINVRLSSREVAYIINHSGSRLLFVDSELANTVEPILEDLKTVNKTIVLGNSTIEGENYEDFLSKSSETEFPVLEDENELISINYTSGTTGLPKGVMYTHRGAYLNALGEVIEAGLDSKSVYLWTLPMFHCNGWCFTWGVTSVGGTHVCLRKIEPSIVWKIIQEEGVTHLCAAPTVLISLTNHPSANEVKLRRKLRIVTAGAPPAPSVIRRVEEMGAEVIHVYGLTETYGPHSVCEWKEEWDSKTIEERARIKARQGVPYLTTGEMGVIDEAMRGVPRDGRSPGEVVMKGNNVMAGYFLQPEETEKAFKGGWFHSGDIAVMHPDGYIEIMDRKKDIIISGGENISSVEVEKVIYEHPDVLEVAVIAVPHETWGEVPKAFITLKPGRNPSTEEIINFCRERIAHFKCPKAVEFGDLPKTATGKIKKFVLREKEWKGYEKMVH